MLFLIAVAARAEIFLAGPRTYLPRAGEAVDARRITVDAQGMVWVSGNEGGFRFDGLRYLPASRLGLPVSGPRRGCKKDCVNVVLDENEGERDETRPKQL